MRLSSFFRHDTPRSERRPPSQPAPVEFEDGLNTIRLLHALYRSNEERRWVRLDEQIESSRLGERNDKLLAEYLINGQGE